MTPVTREGYKFCQALSIPCYHASAQMLLKPSAFMDIAQEIAYWAAQELGFGYDSLHIHHTAWVLSRLHIHFTETPLWRDLVRLYTWHKGANGLFYVRDFDLRAEDGRPLITCTSSWVVINEQTRRLVRPEELASQLSLLGQVDDAIAEPAPKLVLPKDAVLEEAGAHEVSYSDVDIIGHTNNARYMAWAMDALPFEQACLPVRDAYINFNKETRPAETVQLYRCCDGQGAWFVEGRTPDGKSCFIVKLEF